MPIEFKGSNFTLPVIHLYNAKLEAIRQAIKNKISQAPLFLKEAPVVVNISDLTMPINWQELQKTICETGLRIVGISGCKDAKLKEEIDRAGLPLLTEGKEKIDSISMLNKLKTPLPQKHTRMEIIKTRLIDIPVRSGQCIYAQESDLVVTSHVSAGAELIADGNIHIYGMMCGRALAGANGDRDVQIFCTNLTAELISIAGIYCLGDKIPYEFYGKSARLRLSENVLTVQSLN